MNRFEKIAAGETMSPNYSSTGVRPQNMQARETRQPNTRMNAIRYAGANAAPQQQKIRPQNMQARTQPSAGANQFASIR